MMETALRIDPEFEKKIPPLTDREFEQLEKNIVKDGEAISPIVVWNGIIVDGHHRWKILQKHPEIPYKTKEMYFSDKWEAFDWMYSKQLGTRNLTEKQYSDMVGAQYEARKHTHGYHTENRAADGKFQSVQSGNSGKTKVAEQIAQEQKIGYGTVMRAYDFHKGMDAIREQKPELADSILKENTKVSKNTVQAIGKAKPEEQVQMIEAIATGKDIQRKHSTGRVGNRNASKEYKTECDEIRNLIGEIEEESFMEYTIENLTMQIKTNSDAFIRMLSNLIMDHVDLCNEHPDAIVMTIEESVTVRIEQIKERLNNGTQL